MSPTQPTKNFHAQLPHTVLEPKQIPTVVRVYLQDPTEADSEKNDKSLRNKIHQVEKSGVEPTEVGGFVDPKVEKVINEQPLRTCPQLLVVVLGGTTLVTRIPTTPQTMTHN